MNTWHHININKLFIIILFIGIVLNCFSTSHETFKNNKNNNKNNNVKKLIFLGDSLFRNETYVPVNMSVKSKLVNEFGKSNVRVIARDGATISRMRYQINELSEDSGLTSSAELNNKNTYIFLSFGGNDIVDIYIRKTNNETINYLFSRYTRNIAYIKSLYPNANIYLTTVYIPTKPKYKQFKGVISEWNNLIISYAERNNLKILPVDKYVTNPEDFLYGIEPSASGSKKIVNCIKSNI